MNKLIKLILLLFIVILGIALLDKLYIDNSEPKYFKYNLGLYIFMNIVKQLSLTVVSFLSCIILFEKNFKRNQLKVKLTVLILLITIVLSSFTFPTVQYYIISNFSFSLTELTFNSIKLIIYNISVVVGVVFFYYGWMND